jgi:myo-inositol-1(or 4)-monophosphatase
MPDNLDEIAQLTSFMHELADRSAPAILPHFRSQLTVDNKAAGDNFDPVTIADRAAEKLIRDHIQSQYPSHAILGEEHAPKSGDGPYQWVIDPIDGTRAFILGLPTWGTLIGLECDHRPTIGLMNQPYTRDRFWSDGQASYLRGKDDITRQIQTRSTADLAEALIATTDPGLFADGFEANAFRQVQARARSCRYGTDCFAYALLAAGLIDLVIEAGLKPYDIVALIPIIENAGGIITTWEGKEARHGGRIVAAANTSLHAQAIELISHAAETGGP